MVDISAKFYAYQGNNEFKFIWISEAGAFGTDVSQMRCKNLREIEKSIQAHTILDIIPQVKSTDKIAAIKEVLINKLERALDLSNDASALYIITSDDVHFCKRIIPELEKSLELLPRDWRSLHICPGYLWGREKNKPHLDIELPDLIDFDPEGPVPREKIVNTRFSHLFEPAWVGGPLAFVAKHSGIKSILKDIKSKASGADIPDDVTIFKIATNNDYMMLDPLLCHEREQGGVVSFEEEDSKSTNDDAKSENNFPVIVFLIFILLLSYFLYMDRMVANCSDNSGIVCFVFLFCIVLYISTYYTKATKEDAISVKSSVDVDLNKLKHELSTLSSIPKKIHITWKNKKSPFSSDANILKYGIQRLQLQNPHWDIEVSDDDDVAMYLQTHLSASDWLLLEKQHIVEKTDVWRLLKIIHEGGIYTDIDRQHSCQLDEVIANHKCIISWQQGDFTQDMLISAPQNPLFKYALELNLQARRCKVTKLGYLGPTLMFAAFTELLIGIRLPQHPSQNEWNLLHNAIHELHPFCVLIHDSPCDPASHALFNEGEGLSCYDLQESKQYFYETDKVKHWGTQVWNSS